MDRETHSRLFELAKETGQIHVPSKQWMISRSQLNEATKIQEVYCKLRMGYYPDEDTSTETVLQPKAVGIEYRLMQRNIGDVSLRATLVRLGMAQKLYFGWPKKL